MVNKRIETKQTNNNEVRGSMRKKLTINYTTLCNHNPHKWNCWLLLPDEVIQAFLAQKDSKGE